MPIAREIWKEWFSLDDFGAIPCPTCGSGHLSAKKENVYQKETIESSKHRIQNGADPFEYEGRFYALLRCGKCSDHIHAIGRACYTETYEYDSQSIPSPTYTIQYYPVSFYPAPYLIKLSDNIPKEISDELQIAFALFWKDSSACGNRIRVAIENLLDHFRISRQHTNRSPKFLHHRIEEFKRKVSKYAHISDQLMAIKWLGNEASHAAGLSRQDIFDALDLLDYVFDELFQGRRKKLDQLAKRIIDRKGSIYVKPR